jgi:hypothetical protein
MKYRREAVYSSYQADQFLAVGNVYNCTVNSSHGLFNWFFPGHYVIIKPFTGSEYNYWDSDSMAAKLGLVGAYLVTKVSLNLDLVGNKYTTQMETMFESSGLDGLIRKEKDGDDEDPTQKPEQQGEEGKSATNRTKKYITHDGKIIEVTEENTGGTSGGTGGKGNLDSNGNPLGEGVE